MNNAARNPNVPLCFNYPWAKMPDNWYPHIIREYLDWGVDTFVFCDDMLERCIKDSEYVNYLRNLVKDFHIRFVSAHGLAGSHKDLDVPEVEYRENIFQNHVRSMEISSDFGSKTYTIHVGAYYYCAKHVTLDILRPMALDMIERLLPEAEKLGIVIAVENSFEMPNSAKEVLGLVTPFLSSPAIGVCYDTGHANIMASAPGKEMSKYEPYMHVSWWETDVIQEDNALELLQPHVVTTHIHDNTGYGDYHSMPFDGNIPFDKLMPKLFDCPRMMEYQTEICFDYGENWAGKLPAPIGGYSIKRQVETFKKLGF